MEICLKTRIDLYAVLVTSLSVLRVEQSPNREHAARTTGTRAAAAAMPQTHLVCGR
jgi:hypothetical protein